MNNTRLVMIVISKEKLTAAFEMLEETRIEKNVEKKFWTSSNHGLPP